MSGRHDEEDSLLESEYYFSLSDAINDVSLSSGAKETILSGTKLVGKSLSNAVVFSGKLGIFLLKNAPDAIEKQKQIKNKEMDKKVSKAKKILKENPSIEPEKRKKIEEAIERHESKKRET